MLRDTAAKFPNAPELLREQWLFALQTGDAPAALAAIERLTSRSERPDPGEPDDELYWQRGLASRLAGRRADSERALNEGLHSVQREIRGVPASEVHSDTLATIADYYALLGDRQSATDYAHRAVASLPSSGDAANRTDTTYASAIALTWAGEPALAVDRIRQVLDSPGLLKPAFMWCDPLLAPPRGDARFRKMLAERGADVSIDPYRRETWPRPTS